MTQLSKLLPVDKLDNSNLEIINALTNEEIRPIIFELYKWLQDYNWPIAKDVLPILVNYQDEVTHYISNVLNGDDVMWIIWTMELLIPRLTHQNKQLFKSDIEKLTLLDTHNEDTQYIIDSAKKCFSKYYID